MKKSESYKGNVLRAEPVEIDPYHWKSAVVIERGVDETNVKSERYEADETHLAEDKAIASSREFGRQIVDGQHPDLPLP